MIFGGFLQFMSTRREHQMDPLKGGAKRFVFVELSQEGIL